MIVNRYYCLVTKLCPTLRPHGLGLARLLCPWDSPGKKTAVGCYFLLQCMKMKSESEVAQSCSTLRDPMDCSPPGSSVHGIFQARVLEWGAITFSGVSYYPPVKKTQGLLQKGLALAPGHGILRVILEHRK